MERREATFQAIGTSWQIQAAEAVDDAEWSRLLRHIHERIDVFDKTYSRFRADSLVSRMARKAGTYPLPDDGFKLLQFYEQLYAATAGKVTPLIGQTLVEAGYDASYSLEATELHHPPRWEDVLDYEEGGITLKRPALLDFGAAGKGYLVDIIGNLLAEAGVREYVINAGGDILHHSASEQSVDVGMENPTDTSEAIGIVKLSNQSLCASAGNKRKWGTFHHVIDPETLSSPMRIAAVWVIADDALTADGIATALFLADIRTLRSQFSFSYAILDHDMGLEYTKAFPAVIFEEQT